MAKQVVTVRVDKALLARLRRLTVDSKDPYAPMMTQVIERGIELAIRELEKKK